MKLTLTTVFLLMHLFVAAQANDESEKVLKKLSALYNNSEYPALYQMLSAEFRSKASEEQITAFYKSNLKAPLGKIASWSRKESKGDAASYRVLFDNGDIDLELYLNSKSEIAGMQWRPAKKNTEVKKRDASTIKSNNPKQTKLQLIVDSIAVEHLQNPVNSGLSIGIMHDGRVEQFFYGTSKKGTDQLPDSETLYEIGSVSKTFTGIVLAHAINEGKLKTDEDIRKYLPGKYANLQYEGRPITIKHLSNHTSGLPRIPDNLDKQPGYNLQDPYRNYSKEMICEYLKTVTLSASPGTVNEYSNLGVAVLGMVLESVYNRPLEDLVTSFVTIPAKMPNTHFTLKENEKKMMATGYRESDGQETDYWNLGVFNAAGGLKSNLADMLNYLQANMSEINPDFSLSHKRTYHSEVISIGLNWMLTTMTNKQTAVWHNGGTYGFTSFCGYVKEENAGIVVLNNSGVIVDDIAMQIFVKGFRMQQR